ncbi:hypothetical protein C8J56DRAFT_778881, partial [Mycena floridula]
SFWFGINDCGRIDDEDLDAIIEKILDATHRLYISAGARNCIFIDVPPIDRCAWGWSNLVHYQAATYFWGPRDTQATVFWFSAHATFTNILDEPESYGFIAEDVKVEGTIWSDGLHPTTGAVHEILAKRISAL